MDFAAIADQYPVNRIAGVREARELASSIRTSGGPYAFAKAAFGRTAGLATSLADWLGYVGVSAFIAVVFGEYLHRLGIASGVPIPVIAVLVVLAVGVVQALGTRVAGWSQEAGSAIKAVLFLALFQQRSVSS